MSALADDIQMALAQLSQLAPSIGVALSDRQLSQLETYLKGLFLYNHKTNLVADACPSVVVNDHILDALCLIETIRQVPAPDKQRLIDIGSGAGLPGLILAIAIPEMEVCLVDSIAKKTRFLSNLVQELNLCKRVEVITERAEVLGRQIDWRESFHLATSRAVGKIDMTLELALPLLQVGGWLIAQKSQAQLAEEEKRLLVASDLIFAKLKNVVKLNVSGRQKAILCIEKMAQSPIIYPRTAAQIKRSPLAG